MSFVGDILGSITGTKQAGEASQSAAQTQAASSAQAIAVQQEQFNKMVELMTPYVEAGQGALTAQQNLIGLGGTQAQQESINALQQSPQYLEMIKQGENAILQNASATGGVRGGNVQNALAQYRPQLLSDLINQQYGRLGGITQIGQAAASGQASAGLNSSSNIGNLLAQQGSAIAGGQLAAGNAQRSTFGSLLGAGALFAGAGGIGGISKLF